LVSASELEFLEVGGWESGDDIYLVYTRYIS